MTTRISLICHASTSALRAADFPHDEPLDAHGLRTLSAIAEPLRHADRRWTAPALRTRQTAERLDLDATVDPALRDWDYGRWQGRSLADLQAEEPAGVEAWLADPGAAPHGGDTLLDVLSRAAAWLDAQREIAGSVVAVTHAAVVRAAIVAALGAPPGSFWRIDAAPLSITRLTCGHGRWSLVAMGPLATRPTARASVLSAG